MRVLVTRRPPLLPNADKARRELGWTPTPLEAGLAAVVAGLG